MPFVNDFSIGKTASDTPFSRRGQTTSSWGTNGVPVGDKRDPRRGQTAIHIEGLGWFRYTITAAKNGVANKEDVNSDQITGLRVQFTPDRTRNMSGGYTRALIADEGVTFMEWLGKDSDETQIPEDNDDEGQTENPLD